MARTATTSNRYDRRLRTLTRAAVAKDRDRIARELHDGVIQSLYGIGMILEGLKGETFQASSYDQISAITDSINGVIDDIRAYILDLTPARLARRGLGPELCSLAAEFQASSGVITSVRLDDGVERIKAAMGRDLVQIARETLSNAGKHAHASRVVLSLRCTDQNIRFEVTDDGRGFAAKRTSSGRGLANIVKRAESWGGAAEFCIGDAGGAAVRVILPAPVAEKPARGEQPPSVSGPLAIAG
jgi:signal transduction histidine kinase